MQTAQQPMVSLPSPSRWGIHTSLANRPVVMGTLMINSITNNRVVGTVNFRGTPIPITGYWDENTKQIRFDSTYAAFSGNLTLFDDPSIGIRHFILMGQFSMKPPSLQADAYGTWIATTNTALSGPPIETKLPPVGAFLTSNILY